MFIIDIYNVYKKMFIKDDNNIKMVWGPEKKLFIITSNILLDAYQ